MKLTAPQIFGQIVGLVAIIWFAIPTFYNAVMGRSSTFYETSRGMAWFELGMAVVGGIFLAVSFYMTIPGKPKEQEPLWTEGVA